MRGWLALDLVEDKVYANIALRYLGEKAESQDTLAALDKKIVLPKFEEARQEALRSMRSRQKKLQQR